MLIATARRAGRAGIAPPPAKAVAPQARPAVEVTPAGARVVAAASARSAAPPANIRVNDPGEDDGSPDTTESEPSLAVRLPNVVIGYNDSNPVASFCGFSSSTTGGASFVDEGGVPGPQAGDNVLTVDPAGVFFFAMLSTDTTGNASVGVSASTNGGATFGLPVQASAASNGANVFQDKEWITADITGGSHNGNLYLAWTSFDTTPGKESATILFSRSTNGGVTWSAVQALSSTGPSLGHSGAIPAVAPDGTVYVAWLDRATGQLLLVRSDNGGLSFSNPVQGGGPVLAITQIPETLNGNIRANSFPSIAVGPNGVVHLVVAASAGSDHADVLHMRSADRGQTWSAPVRVNDDATSTDQWMPSVAVTSNGVLGVMYYDRRNDPHNLDIDVSLRLSWNDGVSFVPSQLVTTTSFPPAVNFDPDIAVNYMGDYNQMVAPDDRFYLAWGDNRDKVGSRNDPNVYFAVIEPRPVPDLYWPGDFTGSGRTEVLFWAADGNWWLGTWDGTQLHWASVGNPGWFNLNDNQHLNWLGDFTGSGRTEVLFWAADGNWWLGTWDGTQLHWASVSASFVA
jgi:hypothetical protein